MTDAAQNSKQVLAQKGTAATPSFSFLGGNATGMYLAGANQLGFSTAGVNAVTIDASQNVTVTGSFITPTIAGGTTASSTLTLESTTGAGTTDSILFKTGSQSTRMTIDTSGNVGIASGNLTFSGTSQRITGDMSNATIANRLAIQNSIANAGTALQIAPNGTAKNAQLNFETDSAMLNGVSFQINANEGLGEVRLQNGIRGTGTYLPTTFYTGGSERMRIDTSGNVGIGTSSPGYKLDVQASQATMQLKSTTSTNYALLTLQSAGYNYLGVENSAGGALFTGSSAYALTLGTVSAYPLQFATGGSVRATIDPSGNVGIGTVPYATGLFLYKSTAGLVYSDIQNSSTVNSSDGAIQRLITSNVAGSGTVSLDIVKYKSGAVLINNNETNSAAYISFGVGASERMRIDSSGNVGIGVVPSAWYASAGALQIGTGASIFSNNVAYSYFGTNNYFDGANWRYMGTGAAAQYVQAIGNSIWYYAASGTAGNAFTWQEAMRIDTSGNVGIGTSSPIGRLHVSGTDASGPTSLRLQNTTATTGKTWQITSTDAGLLQLATRPGVADYMTVDSSGNVGIGTSSPGYLFDTYNSSQNVDYIAGRFWSSAAATGESRTWLKIEKASAYGGAIGGYLSQGVGSGLLFGTQNGSATPTERMRIDGLGNIIAGASAALATTATNGFLYVPTCAGTPTGTPTAVTGMAPIVVNTTNNKLYFYSGGAWRDAGP